MADTQAKPAPTANDRYRSEVEDTISRLGAAAIGAAKAITTDIPGMIGDAYDMVTGNPGAPNRSNQMFEAITGIKPSGSPAEIVGSLMNPENAVKAMIVGAVTKANKATKAIDNYAVSRYDSNKLSGYTPDENFLDTGVYAGKERGLRSFISDAPAKLKSEPLVPLTEGIAIRESKLEDVLDHPELYSLYPDLKDIKVKPVTGKQNTAYMDFASNTIGIAPGSSAEQLRTTILHEVQHGIQRREGWQSGQNYDILRDPKLLLAEKSLKEKFPEVKNSKDEALRKAYNRYVGKVNQDKDFAFNKYSNTPGEQEARFTQYSADKSRAELEMDIASLLKRGRTPTSSDVKDLGSGVKLTDAEVRALIATGKISK